MKKAISIIAIVVLTILFVYLNSSQSLYDVRGLFSSSPGHPIGGGIRFGFPFIAYEIICSDVIHFEVPRCGDGTFNTVGFIADLAFWTLAIGGLVILKKKWNTKKQSLS